MEKEQGFVKYLFLENDVPSTDSQPETFEGRGSFVKWGHSEKNLFKEKMSHREGFWRVFFLDTLKTTFWMAN